MLMAVLGWIAFIFGGAFLCAAAVYFIAMMTNSLRGLESLPLLIAAAALAAAIWIAFALWLSPLSISFS